jgi:hypothetical protein
MKAMLWVIGINRYIFQWANGHPHEGIIELSTYMDNEPNITLT